MYKAGRKRWAQKAEKRMEQNETKGSLTEIAHKHGFKKALPFARKVEAHPSKYSKSVEKKSRFAVNINK